MIGHADACGQLGQISTWHLLNLPGVMPCDLSWASPWTYLLTMCQAWARMFWVMLSSYRESIPGRGTDGRENRIFPDHSGKKLNNIQVGDMTGARGGVSEMARVTSRFLRIGVCVCQK